MGKFAFPPVRSGSARYQGSEIFGVPLKGSIRVPLRVSIWDL